MSFCILYDDDWLDSRFEDDHFDPRPPAPPQNQSAESTDEVDCVASRRPLEEGRGGGSVTSPPAPPSILSSSFNATSGGICDGMMV